MVSLRPNVASHEVKAEGRQLQPHRSASTAPARSTTRTLSRVSGVVRDNNPGRPYRRQALQHRPEPDLEHRRRHRLTFLGQFNRDDTGITSQFLPLREPSTTRRSARFPHHKNLGDPDWEYYDRTYWLAGLRLRAADQRCLAVPPEPALPAQRPVVPGGYRAQLMPTAHWNAAPPRWMKTSVSS